METKYESEIGSINWDHKNKRRVLAFTANASANRAAKLTQDDFMKLILCVGFM